MIFGSFLLDANESNAFVLGCEETREALLVDVGDADPRIEEFLDQHGLRLTTVFITHDHYDHTGGLDHVLREHDVEVLSGRGDAGGRNARRVRHGDEVRIGQLAGAVLATPGHTPDSVSLAFPGLVFTGDALFAGSVGGTTSSANARQEIEHIRKHIFALPDECEIHPGHGPASTVGVERQYNPFFA